MQAVTGTGDGASTSAGYVALVGRPNVGKSTLLNALVGEKLSIVTPRAQTTRERVLGILTTERTQVVFVDTPGLLEPKYRLQQSMLETALSAVADSDLVLLLLDGSRPDELPDATAIDAVRRRRNTLLVAVNKQDVAVAAALKTLKEWSTQQFALEPVEISAHTGAGLGTLQKSLEQRLPESPFFFPADDLAVQSVRFFVGELVRETVFEASRTKCRTRRWYAWMNSARNASRCISGRPYTLNVKHRSPSSWGRVAARSASWAG
jgi:GTP-binding protein Era